MIKGKQLEQNSVPQNRLDSVSQAKLNNSALDNDFDNTPPPNGSIQVYNGTTSQWEAQFFEPGYIYFPIYAEENQALGNNAWEWSFGANDASSVSDFGIQIPIECELEYVTLSIDSPGVDTTINIYRNTTIVGVTDAQSVRNQTTTFITPITYSAGDTVNFQTLAAGGAGNGGRVAAWFRYQLQGLRGQDGATFNDQLFGDGIPSNGLGNDGDIYFDNLNNDIYAKVSGSWFLQQNIKGDKGDQGDPGNDGLDGTNFNDQLFGNGAPSNGLGNDGDIYFDNDNGDLYNKVSGTWLFQQNIQGPTGDAVLRFIEVTNTPQTTVNDSSTGTPWTSINTTPTNENLSAGLYTVATDSVSVLAAGKYDLYANFHYTGSVARGNAGIRFSVNGIAVGPQSASAYLRNSGGHNESSTNLNHTVDLSINDTVSIIFYQLAGTGTMTIDAGLSNMIVKKIA